ncbi:MAG: SDR family oxidoreductase [Pseudomonadales bacterium]|nr:SDR family oxidoreductase [Pseudomonadales bacterium]
MNILITGNMGYVGPLVVAHFRKTFPNAKLFGVDLGFFSHCLTTFEAIPEKRLNAQYFMDVRSLDKELLSGMDAVIHLAAISNDPMGKAYEQVTDEINHRSSIEIAKMARSAGVGHYVFASSCSVYGFTEGGPRNESSPLNPLTAYAHSKIDTERDICDLATDDFTITCLRFPTACGMSDRLRLDLVLNDFVASAVVNNKIDILSDGTPWRPLIDVKDMARAMEWASTRTIGEPFLTINVGRNEWNYQVKDLAQAVKDHIPHIDIQINPNAPPDKRSYQVNFDQYKSMAPDHLPQIDLARSISEIHTGLKQIGFSDKNFRDSRFIRLNVLNSHQQEGSINNRLNWTQ